MGVFIDGTNKHASSHFRRWGDIALYLVNREAKALAEIYFGVPRSSRFPFNPHTDTFLIKMDLPGYSDQHRVEVPFGALEAASGHDQDEPIDDPGCHFKMYLRTIPPPGGSRFHRPLWSVKNWVDPRRDCVVPRSMGSRIRNIVLELPGTCCDGNIPELGYSYPADLISATRTMLNPKKGSGPGAGPVRLAELTFQDYVNCWTLALLSDLFPHLEGLSIHYRGLPAVQVTNTASNGMKQASETARRERARGVGLVRLMEQIAGNAAVREKLEDYVRYHDRSFTVMDAKVQAQLVKIPKWPFPDLRTLEIKG